MLRALELAADGSVTTSDDLSKLAPPPRDGRRWIDLGGDVSDMLDRLRAAFDFHPLTIEDCRQFDQRPKLEEYRNHLFLVTQGFSFSADSSEQLLLHELHAFLGDNYLVTVHTDPIAALDEVWQRARDNPGTLERGVDFVCYLVAGRLAESNFPIVDRIADELEELEDRVLSAPAKPDLSRIFELKRKLIMMRKVLSPQRDTMAMLARRGDPRVSERTSHYFRDVHDQLVRLNESIEANRDLLANALDAYLSSVSNRTNEIMKYLTLLSAVFLPLAFIVGFFGQNFASLPGVPRWVESERLMHAMIALCVGTPIIMLLWFRSRHWI